MTIKQTWLCSKPIAHRGLHNADLPENSIGAFEHAIEKNFAIELDVQLSKDGEVIVFHDSSLSRMTMSDGYVSNSNLSDLKNLRLLETDYKISTLNEVLEVVDGKTPILVEIKNDHKVGELENKALNILKNYSGEFAVQSFNPYSLEYFKENYPQITRGQLSTFFSKNDLGFVKRNLLKKLKLNHVSKPDFIAYNGAYLPNKYVSKTELPVLAWTIRSSDELERVKDCCDNIIFEGFMPYIETKNE